MSEEPTTITEEPKAPEEKPATKVVDFGETQVELPADQADAIIAERQKLKEAKNELALKLQAEAEAKAAAEQKALNEAKRAQAAEALKKQDIEAAERILNEQHQQRISEMASVLKDLHLQRVLAGREDIVPSAVGDIAEALGSKLTLGDNNTLAVAGPDGLPLTDPQTGTAVGVDAFIEQYLNDRPHYKRSTIPSSTQAAPGGEAPPSTEVRQSQLNQMSGQERAKLLSQKKPPKIIADTDPTY